MSDQYLAGDIVYAAVVDVCYYGLARSPEEIRLQKNLGWFVGQIMDFDLAKRMRGQRELHSFYDPGLGTHLFQLAMKATVPFEVYVFINKFCVELIEPPSLESFVEIAKLIDLPPEAITRYSEVREDVVRVYDASN